MSKIDKSTDGTEYAEQVESLAYNLLSIIGKFAFTTPIQNWIFSDFAKTAPALVEYMYKMLSCDTPEIRREVIKMLPKIPHLDSCSVQECESVEVFFRSLCRDPKTEKQLFFVWVCCSLMKSQPILEKELDFTQITNDNIDVYLQALQRIFAPQLSDAELVLKGATFKRAMLYLQERSKLQGVKDARLELMRRRTEIVQNPTLFQELIEPILAESRQERVTKMHEKIAQQVEETVPVAQTISSSEEVSVLTEAVEVSPQQVTVKSETAGYHRAIKDCLQWLPEDDPRRLQLQTALESGFYDRDIAHEVIIPIIQARGKIPSIRNLLAYFRNGKVLEEATLHEQVRAGHLARIERHLKKGSIIEASGVIHTLLSALFQGKDEFTKAIFKIREQQNSEGVKDRLEQIKALVSEYRDVENPKTREAMINPATGKKYGRRRNLMGGTTKTMLLEDKNNLVYQYPPLSEADFQATLLEYKNLGDLEQRSGVLEQYLKDPTLSKKDRLFLVERSEIIICNVKNFLAILKRLNERKKDIRMQYCDQNGDVKTEKNGSPKWVSFYVHPTIHAAEGYIQVKDEAGHVYAIRQDRVILESIQKKPQEIEIEILEAKAA